MPNNTLRPPEAISQELKRQRKGTARSKDVARQRAQEHVNMLRAKQRRQGVSRTNPFNFIVE